MSNQDLRKSTRTIVLIALFLCFSLVSPAQNYLSVPVDFIVENGDFELSVLNVKKNGVEVFAIPGKRSLKLRLEYNSDYLLSFSKPGYITKKINVSTFAPESNIKESFEPYKIGVKLFKQYEGINTVVFNQPVARIYYNAAIDNFSYDVDYTKSILSILQKTEAELEIRAAEERAVGHPVDHTLAKEDGTTEFSTSTKMDESDHHQPASTAPFQRYNQSIITEPLMHQEESQKGLTQAGDNSPLPDVAAASESTVHQRVLQDHSPANTLPVTTEEETADQKQGLSDNDDVPLSPPISGEEHMSAHPFIETGGDFKNIISVNQSNDIPEAGRTSYREIKKTRTYTAEPGRNITIVSIIQGGVKSQYRKVDYKWGGVYYFKDDGYAISRDVYHYTTGEY